MNKGSLHGTSTSILLIDEVILPTRYWNWGDQPVWTEISSYIRGKEARKPIDKNTTMENNQKVVLTSFQRENSLSSVGTNCLLEE